MRPIRILLSLSLVLLVGCKPQTEDPAPPKPDLVAAAAAAVQAPAPDVPAPDVSEPATPDGASPAPEITNHPSPIANPPADCTPDCLLRACGSDGCGGTCGACDDGETCKTGRCVSLACVPACTERTCGPDGCGGSCGTCPAPGICAAGACRARIGVGLFGGSPGTPGDGPAAADCRIRVHRAAPLDVDLPVALSINSAFAGNNAAVVLRRRS